MSDSTVTERPAELSTEQWLGVLAHKLDILAMILMDLRRDMRDLGVGMAYPEDDTDAPLPEMPKKTPQQGEDQIITDGNVMYVRRPLPGKHWLMLTIDAQTTDITQIRMELPNGERVPITAEELQTTFGIVLNDQFAEPTDLTADSLNPDVETPDER